MKLIQTIGLNMGQLLSLPFIIAGIWLIIKANKSKKVVRQPQKTK
jgi:prolipoprotein diacylglyceryltransferase